MSDTHREGPQDRLKNVAFTGDHSLTPTSSKPVSTRRKWVSRTHTSTNFDEALIESRALRHAQIIRRPRAFAYSKGDTSSGTRPGAEERILLTSVSHSGRGSNGDRGERSTDDISKQLDRLSLFVDLVWVGIIANLSATFGEQVCIHVLGFIVPFPGISRALNYEPRLYTQFPI
jgi:hypothetical protein